MMSIKQQNRMKANQRRRLRRELKQQFLEGIKAIEDQNVALEQFRQEMLSQYQASLDNLRIPAHLLVLYEEVFTNA